jgi:hypothetical protein
MQIDLMNRMITIGAEKMKNDEYLGIPFPENVYRGLCALQRLRASADTFSMTRESRCIRLRFSGPSGRC